MDKDLDKVMGLECAPGGRCRSDKSDNIKCPFVPYLVYPESTLRSIIKGKQIGERASLSSMKLGGFLWVGLSSMTVDSLEGYPSVKLREWMRMVYTWMCVYMCVYVKSSWWEHARPWMGHHCSRREYSAGWCRHYEWVGMCLQRGESDDKYERLMREEERGEERESWKTVSCKSHLKRWRSKRCRRSRMWHDWTLLVRWRISKLVIQVQRPEPNVDHEPCNDP